MTTKKDRWPLLLREVADDDGLVVRDCGAWTEDKLYFWQRYIDITTSAMVGHSKWPEGLVYVDLFAGPGVCRVRESGKRLPGSPLIAARAPKAFRKIIAVELDVTGANALRERMSKTQSSSQISVLTGDCNTLIDEVVRAIPDRSLTLAFIDPPGFDARFSTLEKLAQSRRVDFLLLFADSIDLVRNVDLYRKQEVSKVDEALGTDSGWRDCYEALANRTLSNVRELFVDLYEDRVRKRLGYQGIRTHVIRGPQGPLYSLIYASKNEKGLEFWDKIATVDRRGQSNLF